MEKLHWRLEVLGGDQVKGTDGEGAGEIVLLKVNASLNADYGCVSRGSVKSGSGHVDGSHPPAMLGQPNRIPSFTRAKVQRCTRRERPDEINQDSIRSPAPHSFMFPVVPLPELRGLAAATLALQCTVDRRSFFAFRDLPASAESSHGVGSVLCDQVGVYRCSGLQTCGGGGDDLTERVGDITSDPHPWNSGSSVSIGGNVVAEVGESP